jgi:hypothetical protein
VKPTQPASANRFNPLTTTWNAFLILCLLAGFLKTLQNEQYRSDTEFFYQERRRIEGKVNAQYVSDRNLLRRRSHPNPWTISDLETEINGGQPFTLEASPKDPTRRTARWRRSPDDSTWQLEFNSQGELMRTSSRSANAHTRLSPVSRATFEDAGERFRKQVAQWGPMCWIVLLVAWICLPSRRNVLSHVLLMIATATAMAQLVSPGYRLRDLFSNDPLFIGSVMVAISLATLARTSPQLGDWVAAHLLPRRFGIRWILGLTACAAVLVRLGWYGMVIGSIMAAAFLWYAGMSFLVRRPTLKTSADSSAK